MFEDAALTEDERLDRLDKVMRHETALQRQIDTAVKLLAKDVPQLYTRRLRDQVLEDLHITERECREEPETDLGVTLETSNRLYQLRKATKQAVNELSVARLDTEPEADDNEICQNELAHVPAPLSASGAVAPGQTAAGSSAPDFNPGAFLHGETTPKFAKTNPPPACQHLLPLTHPAPGGVARNESG